MNKPEFVYCGNCHRDVHYHFEPVHHWKHLLLSVFLLGLWLPIWFSAAFFPTKLCDQCGKPLWDDPSPKSLSPSRKAS